jgi:hypothetical protein
MLHYQLTIVLFEMTSPLRVYEGPTIDAFSIRAVTGPFILKIP